MQKEVSGKLKTKLKKNIEKKKNWFCSSVLRSGWESKPQNKTKVFKWENIKKKYEIPLTIAKGTEEEEEADERTT